MDLASSITEWIAAHPHYIFAAVFVLALLESAPLVGSLVPGSTAIVGVGALVAERVEDIVLAIILAVAGAVIGDGLSYWLGRGNKRAILKIWPFRNHPEFIERGEEFFHAYGGKSIFAARFIPPIRAVIPLVAGMLDVEPGKFFVANIPAAIGWALLHTMSGVAIAKSFVLIGGNGNYGIIAAIVLLVAFGAMMWGRRLFKRDGKSKRAGGS